MEKIIVYYHEYMGFPGSAVVKNLLPMQDTQEMWVQSLHWKDSPEAGNTLLQYSCLEISMGRGAW